MCIVKNTYVFHWMNCTIHYNEVNTFLQLCVSNSGELDITVCCRCKSNQSRQHNCLWGIWVSTVLVRIIMRAFLSVFTLLCKEHPLTSSCLSVHVSAVLPVCPHVSTWLPMGGFWWNFVLDTFMKVYEDAGLFKIEQRYWTLCMET